MVASLASLGPTLLMGPCRGGVTQHSIHPQLLSVLTSLLGTSPQPDSIYKAEWSGDHKAGEHEPVALGRRGMMNAANSQGSPQSSGTLLHRMR